MSYNGQKTRVALVYPPYGPPNMANLGLAILSAGLKQRGFPCRTFYWNYNLIEALPYSSSAEKRKIYELLTQRDFFPWNEWVFMRFIFPMVFQHRDAEVLQRLAALDSRLADQTHPFPPSQLVLHLFRNVSTLLDQISGKLAKFDVVGISTTFFQNGAALALAHHVKARWPGKVIVLGGANCDGEMGQALAEHFPCIDYAFSGEVDHIFPEFIRLIDEDLPVDHLPGIHFRNGRVAGTGPPQRPVEDMNALPIPDFDDFIAERKRFRFYDEGQLCLPLESSRGCWWGEKHHCIFCGLNANGMAYRQKSHDRFEREVETVVDRYRPRYLFMADNILSAKYYKEFVHWAKRRQLKIDFFYEIKANVKRQQVADLVDAGISMVQPGIESFSTPILRLMRKGVRGIQNIAFLKYARDHGLLPAYNLLAGFPGEDPYEYEQMAREVPKLVHLYPPNGVLNVEFHRFSPFHNDPEHFGIKLRPHENYSFIYPLQEDQIARLAYFFELEGRAADDLSYLAKLKAAVLDWRQRYQSERCTLTWERDKHGLIVKDRRPGFPACNYLFQNHAITVFETLDSPITLGAVRDTVRTASGGSYLPDPAPAASPDPPLYMARTWRTTSSAAHFPPARSSQTERPAGPGASWFSGGAIATGSRVIAFTAQEFEDDPAACIAPLLAAGIIYSDEGLYLALPVNAQAPGTEPGWSTLGI
jgi:ribosomal peptide maturation radical SAM protein 1